MKAFSIWMLAAVFAAHLPAASAAEAAVRPVLRLSTDGRVWEYDPGLIGTPDRMMRFVACS
jgi:hypothetical protein